jgi:hypothetical protein
MSVIGYPLSNPRFKAFVQGTNTPLSGGLVQFYLTGTTTPAPVYAEIACTTPLSNPVVLDTNGEAEIYGNQVYDILVYSSSSVLQYTMLGISFSPGTTAIVGASEWIAITGAATYVNASQFSVAGDQTSTFTVGRRVKAIISSGTVIYGTVTASAYTSSTLVTLSFDASTLDSGLSSITVGILGSHNTSIPTLTPLPVVSGGTTAYTLTIQGIALIAGAVFKAKVGSSNTGASTMVINGSSAIAIKKFGSTALVAGDMQGGEIHSFGYDGTNLQLLNPYTVNTAQLSLATIVGTQISGLGSSNIQYGSNSGATSISPTIPAGTWLIFAIANMMSLTFSGTSTLTIDGTNVMSLNDQGDPAGYSPNFLFGATAKTYGSPTAITISFTEFGSPIAAWRAIQWFAFKLA